MSFRYLLQESLANARRCFGAVEQASFVKADWGDDTTLGGKDKVLGWMCQGSLLDQVWMEAVEGRRWA